MNIKKLSVSERETILLQNLGANIKIDRMRGELSADDLGKALKVGRQAVWLMEEGSASVDIHLYFKALFFLGFEKDFIRYLLWDERKFLRILKEFYW